MAAVPRAGRARGRPEKIAPPGRVRFLAPVLSPNRRAFVAWFLVFTWLGVLLTASGDSFSFARSSRFLRPLLEWLLPHLPEEQMWRVVAGARKLAHVAEYFLLALLARRAWRLTGVARGLAFSGLHLALLAFGLATAGAALDEYRQSFTSSRQGSGWDVLLDASGAALGLLCLRLFLVWRERRRAACQPARPSGKGS